MPLVSELNIIYPDSDGKPMAENTRQYNWIVKIKEGLEITTEGQHIFVAADLFWYAVEGRPDIRLAPDAMVAIGRPKGDRGSYMQWVEEGIAPQVVFEILSPGNTAKEMKKKHLFYQKHGVEEYYIYDPDHNDFKVYLRKGAELKLEEGVRIWVSPLLGIRFEWKEPELEIYQPDGELFISPLEREQLRKRAIHLAKKEKRQRELAQQRADQEKQRAEEERRKRELLEQELKRLQAIMKKNGLNGKP